MSALHLPHSILRLTAVVVASAYLSACSLEWRELAPQPPGGFRFDSTATYRVLLASGDSLTLSHAKAVGDSLVWITQVSGGTVWFPVTRTVPLTQIRRVEVQRASAGGAILAILFVAGLLGLATGASGGFGGFGGFKL